MTIYASDLPLLKAERMTDDADSGGYPTANVIQDNVDNNLFPDVDSGQRVAGYSQLRKFFAALRSPNDETFMGARLYLSSPPEDDAVSVALFPCADGDEQPELLDVLYRYTTEGANSNYRLYTTYGIGSTTIALYFNKDQGATVYQSVKPTLPIVAGQRLILEDSGLNSRQLVIVQSVAVSQTTDGSLDIYTLTLLEPLEYTFRGALLTLAGDKDAVTQTQAYFVAPLSIPVIGISPLDVAADDGDRTVVVSSLNAPLGVQTFMQQAQSALDVGWSRSATPCLASVHAASAGRQQLLPVIGDHTVLTRIEYYHNNAWQVVELYSLGVNGGNFLVTLPVSVSASTPLVYFSRTSGFGSPTTKTDFVFVLPAPVIPGSASILGLSDLGNTMNSIDDGVGGWTGIEVAGSIDYDTGLVQVTLNETCEPLNVSIDALVETTVNLDVSGSPVDLRRLPPDKTAPIFRLGETVIVHHTLNQTLANPLVADTTYTLSRANVDQIWLEDSVGARIPTGQYTVNLTAGSIHTAVGLNLTGYQQPIKAFTTLEDESLIIGIAGNTLSLNQALTHDYPLDGNSYVSSIYRMGYLRASVSVPFAQQAWTEVWSDTRIGNAITPQYNHATYPPVATNQGAITERWRIQFTSTTLVNIIGEKVGQIATGLSITASIAPINPNTGVPYFTLDEDGWGAAWQPGHLLRFNTTGAHRGLGAVRVVQPSPHVPGVSDRIRITYLGDVDA